MSLIILKRYDKNKANKPIEYPLFYKLSVGLLLYY